MTHDCDDLSMMKSGTFLRFVSFLLVSISWPIRAKCPDNLEEKVQECIKKQTPLKDRSSIIGIDMERLRIMCSEFHATMRCLGHIVNKCPEHTASVIESSINSKEELPHQQLMHKLCSVSDLYEKYSLHFNCIDRHKGRLRQCYQTFEKSMEPFVRSHDMTSQVCSPVSSLMSCMDASVASSCNPDSVTLLRHLVGPMMPHGVAVEACPAITGEEAKKVTSPAKAITERYKVLYDPVNKASLAVPSSWMTFVCFSLLPGLINRWWYM